MGRFVGRSQQQKNKQTDADDPNIPQVESSSMLGSSGSLYLAFKGPFRAVAARGEEVLLVCPQKKIPKKKLMAPT